MTTYEVLYQMAHQNGIDVYISVFFISYLFFLVCKKCDFYILSEKIFAFLENRSLFIVRDIGREEVWINLLRIVAGLIIIDRSYNIMFYELLLEPTPERAIISICSFTAGLAVTIGFFTPIFVALLFLFNVQLFDQILNTYTLGSSAQQLLLMIFLFLPAGRKLSFDGCFVDKENILGKSIRATYSFFGVPTINRTALIKFFGFISYGLLCLWSVYEHFKDPFWLSGEANVYLLTSNWLTNPHELFRYLFNEYKSTAIYISIFLIYVMMAWELLLIPLGLLKGIPRLFVIWYGIAFFLVSMFVLQLSKLPHYQFIFWAILFWKGYGLNRLGHNSIDLLYDDRCNLCDKTVTALIFIDLFKVIKLKPISKNIEFAKKNGLSEKDILTDLFGIDSNTSQSFKGYYLYLELTKRLFLLVPFFPLLYLGKLLRVGLAIYRIVAQNRVKAFGVCEIPTLNIDKIEKSRQPETNKVWVRNTFLNAFIATYLFFMTIHLTQFPVLRSIPVVHEIGESFKWIKKSAWLHGQIELIVFTPQVLHMGTHYFTVTRVMQDGSKTLLPYVGKNGERLDLVLKSDRIYFGHALGWRREMYGLENQRVCYNKDRDDFYLHQLFLLFDKKYKNKADHYKIDFYHQDLGKLIKEPNYKFVLPEKEFVCSIKFSGQDWTEIP